MYLICTYVGDFPVPRQPQWGKEYSDLEEAKAAARIAYALLHKHKNRYTVVQEDDGVDIPFCIHEGQETVGDEATAKADSLCNEEDS